jgi:transposase
MSASNGKTRSRRQFTAEDKATILKRHLADKVPISDLCEEYRIQPSLFYLWQRQALENLSAAFRDGRVDRGPKSSDRERARIAALEAKLVTKDAVIAEVSEEYLALKKKLSGS